MQDAALISPADRKALFVAYLALRRRTNGFQRTPKHAPVVLSSNEAVAATTCDWAKFSTDGDNVQTLDRWHETSEQECS